MGHDKIFDHMMLDGLEDAYEAGRSMGTFGEDCAANYQFTREQQDKFAMTRRPARKMLSIQEHLPPKSPPSPSAPARAKSRWSRTKAR